METRQEWLPIESLRRGRRVRLFAIVCFAIQGCADRQELNPSAAVEQWELDPSPLMEIGLVDGTPGEVFSGVNAIGFLGDGGLVVGNASGATLRVFDATGTFEREFGGEGEGPGEFAYLADVQVLPGDTVLAYDPVAFRLSAFERSGQTIGTVQMEALDGAPEVYLGRDRAGQHLVALIRPTQRDPTIVTADQWEVRRYDSDGSGWVSLGTFSGMRRLRSPVPLSPHFIGAVLGDTAFVTDGLLAEVHALAPTGASVRSVQPIELSWTPSEARRRLEDNVEDAALAQRLRDAEVGASWDSVPHFSDALSDPSGLLWLKRYDPGTDSHWVSRQRSGGRWIATATDGGPVATLAVPDDFRMMVVGSDRVAGVRTDDLGVERVVVYRLRRNGPAG